MISLTRDHKEIGSNSIIKNTYYLFNITSLHRWFDIPTLDGELSKCFFKTAGVHVACARFPCKATHAHARVKHSHRVLLGCIGNPNEASSGGDQISTRR
jgi:hypothetical protein